VKKLVRPIKPDCLSKYKPGKDPWNKVTYEHKQEIWISLHSMQGQYCAYCESDLNKSGKQIEHFRSRQRFNRLTFSWDNLFGACDEPNRCGNHKDNRKRNFDYNPDDLIKPDKDTLLNYVRVLDDGSMKCEMTICERDRVRAEATIKVFNLNGDPALVGLRRLYIDTVKSYAENLSEVYGENYDAINHELRKIMVLWEFALQKKA
jgi:uncharacterized protein (TIGR02646 family)